MKAFHLLSRHLLSRTKKRTTRKAFVCGILTATSAHGAVIFTDMPDRGFYSAGTWITQPIDFNDDGVDDMVFRNFGATFVAFSTSTSAIAGIAAKPPDQNSFAPPFESGSIIGPSFSNSSLYTWNEGYSGLVSVRLIGFETVVLGLWVNEGAYLGVEFKIGEDTHYGWIEVDTPFLAGGGVIKAFAYESEPGVPIIAGVIPEPSSALLVAFCGGIALGTVVTVREDERASLPSRSSATSDQIGIRDPRLHR